MKKLFSLVAVATFSVSIHAQTALTEENAVLQPGHNLSKFYNFYAMTVDDNPYEWGSSSTAADFTVGGVSMYQATGNGLSSIYVQSGDVRQRTDRGPYLCNYGSGPRRYSLAGLKKGQIVIVNDGVYMGEYDFDMTPLSANAREITDSIHSCQEELDVDEDGEPDGTNDGCYYYEMVEDGRLDLLMARGHCVSAIQVWTPAGAAEYVTNPEQTLIMVSGTSRYVQIKPGESSLGNEVSTWYTFDGTDPIYMEVADSVLQTVQVETVNDDGETVLVDSTYYIYYYAPAGEDGMWGDWIYTDDYIEFSDADDDDGDGFVVIKCASVTSTGVVSEVSSVVYSVTAIELNKPTLTLVNMDKTTRDYQLGWTNNTLCGEEFFFKAVTGEGETLDNLAIGDVIRSASTIKVTVSAEGYAKGEEEIEVIQRGVSYERKNVGTASQGLHDWDFLNLPEEDVKMLKGEVIDYAFYVDPASGDTIRYTVEEYEQGETESGDIIPESGTEVVYKWSGWDYDASRNRAFMNVTTDTIYSEDGSYTVEAHYTDGVYDIFRGLLVDCPPNAKNNSTIGIYVTNDLGLYFMSKPTVTIEGLQYGEYVVMGFGYGGSNWVDSRWTTCEMSEGETYTKTFSGAGQFLEYIDIYTSDNLPDGINDVVSSVKKADATVYSIDGRVVRRNAVGVEGLKPGLYILNGKKYLVK